MIVSPPFLPPRVSNESEAAWFERAMRGGEAPRQGMFPLSALGAWHGGLHLIAPDIAGHPGQYESVRAIADGVVIYRRAPTPVDPSLDHPLRYRSLAEKPCWTHDGVVVIRHDTEIGEGETAKVSFYSITQHLCDLDEHLPAVNAKIFRKAKVGVPGSIFGDCGRIHFEIIVAPDHVEMIFGRTTRTLSVTKNGRTDSLFGDIYVRLPVGTQWFQNVLFPDAQHPQRPTMGGPGPAVSFTSTEISYVGLHYERGDCTATLYADDGQPIGHPFTESGKTEYGLFSTATKRYPACPSAGYELLRFGRVVGPDTLDPAGAAHWRKIPYPDGEAWVNLNASSVFVFSDADMPHWRGWQLVDDDADGDVRCNSSILESILDSRSPGTKLNNSATVENALSQNGVSRAISRLVCKFPTEWEDSDKQISVRFGWLKESMKTEAYEKLALHIKKLGFWGEIGKLAPPATHWHVNPKEFIQAMQACSWLSSTDLARCLDAAPVAGRIRAETLRVDMNKMMRKYLISCGLRASHYLAQVGHETGWWYFRQEIGLDLYFKTMYEVITEAEARHDYITQSAHKLSLVLPNETENAYASRRPGVVLGKAAAMWNGSANASHGGLAGDGARFRGRGFLQITGRKNYLSYGKFRAKDFASGQNSQLLESDNFNCCDTSGFYWAREKANIEADAGYSPSSVTRVGGLVNRGSADRTPLHDQERRAAFLQIWDRLNDLL